MPVADAVRAYFETRRPAGVDVAYLFGSAARARSHRESDVDVAVLFDYTAVPDRTSRSRAALRLGSELVGATHCNDVDVVVLNDAPVELAASILRQGVRLYCADPEADHAFCRTAFLRHADVRPFLERTRRVKLRTLSR
jgi:predicted nucleotidyltransferase